MADSKSESITGLPYLALGADPLLDLHNSEPRHEAKSKEQDIATRKIIYQHRLLIYFLAPAN